MARTSEFKTLNMRVSPDAKELLAELAGHMGISQTAALETMILKAAREEGLVKRRTALNSGSTSFTGDKLKESFAPKSAEYLLKRVKELESLPSLGARLPDEPLTSEYFYGDHD